MKGNALRPVGAGWLRMVGKDGERQTVRLRLASWLLRENQIRQDSCRGQWSYGSKGTRTVREEVGGGGNAQIAKATQKETILIGANTEKVNVH